MLIRATAHDHSSAVSFCLSHGAIIDGAVRSAAIHKNATPELWGTLISAGWNNTPAGLSALLGLSSGRGLQMNTMLLDRGANPQRGLLGAARSSKDDSIEIMALHLARGAALRGSGALQIAAEYGRAAMIAYLIEKGADVNEVPENDPCDPRELENGAALHAAARANRPEVVKMLLESGAHPSMKNQRGESALDIARMRPGAEASQIIALLENA